MISRLVRRASLLILLLWTAPHPNAAFASEYHWWNKMIGATQSNQIKLRNGNGVTVGVLDGLANYNLPEFGGRLYPRQYPTGTYNYSERTVIAGPSGALPVN